MTLPRGRATRKASDEILDRHGFGLLRRPGVFSVRSSRNQILIAVDDPKKRRGQFPEKIENVRVRLVRGRRASLLERMAGAKSA